MRLFAPEAAGSQALKQTGGQSSAGTVASVDKSSQRKASVPDMDVPLPSNLLGLEKKLKAWRLEEAKSSGVAAFVVLSNRTLRSIVMIRPRTISDLLRVPGIGPAKAERFGESICSICISQ
jgi:ATP-dependent DNA helicase RecQ